MREGILREAPNAGTHAEFMPGGLDYTLPTMLNAIDCFVVSGLQPVSGQPPVKTNRMMCAICWLID